jgi:hypothetical protein
MITAAYAARCALALGVCGLLLVSMQSHAQSHAPQHGQSLGRLFSTPEQRRMLDEARGRYDPTRQEIIYKQGPAPVAEPEPPAPRALPELLVNGLVVRASGGTSAWVNGTQLRSGETTADGIQLQSADGAVKFVLPSGTDTSAIKPGQLLDPNVGEVKEVYTHMSAAARLRREQELRQQPQKSAANATIEEQQ